MLKKIGLFFVASVAIFIAGGIALGNTYTIQKTYFASTNEQALTAYLSDVANWTQWFYPKHKHAQVENNTLTLTTKNDTIIRVELSGTSSQTFAFVINATGNEIHTTLQLEPMVPSQERTKITAILQGKSDFSPISGYTNLFIKASLEGIFNSSFAQLDKVFE